MAHKFFFVWAFALSSLVASIWSICHTAQEMDRTCGMEIVYFGNRHLVLPIDEPHYAENCGIYENGMNCLQEYVGSCLSDQTQQIGSMIVKNVRLHYAKRCKDPTFRGSFIQHNQCFRNETILEQFHQCADRWHHMIEQLKNYKPEIYVNANCCIFLDFQKCIEEKNVQMCHDIPGNYWNVAFDEIACFPLLTLHITAVIIVV